MVFATMESGAMAASHKMAAAGRTRCAEPMHVHVPFRLNLRGRVVAALLCALLTWVTYSWVLPQQADSAPTPMQVTTYTVQPGDTLWFYAEMITPQGGDVSQRVEELIRLNHLDSYMLEAGQSIVVPQQQE